MWKKGLSCNNQNLFTYHRYFLNKAKDFYGKQCPMCIFINTNDDSNNWIKKVLANSRWHTCEQIFNSMSAYYLIYVFFFLHITYLDLCIYDTTIWSIWRKYISWLLYPKYFCILRLKNILFHILFLCDQFILFISVWSVCACDALYISKH